MIRWIGSVVAQMAWEHRVYRHEAPLFAPAGVQTPPADALPCMLAYLVPPYIKSVRERQYRSSRTGPLWWKWPLVEQFWTKRKRSPEIIHEMVSQMLSIKIAFLVSNCLFFACLHSLAFPLCFVCLFLVLSFRVLFCT